MIQVTYTDSATSQTKVMPDPEPFSVWVDSERIGGESTWYESFFLVVNGRRLRGSYSNHTAADADADLLRRAHRGLPPRQ